MKITNFFIILLSCSIVFSISCYDSLNSPDQFDQKIVIQGYIYSGSKNIDVQVRKTISIDEKYSPEKSAVSGANVNLTVDGKTFNLIERTSNKGTYFIQDSLIIQSGKTYILNVNTTEPKGTITAQTIVPDTFHIINVNVSRDTINFENEDVIKVTLEWTESENSEGYKIAVFKATDDTASLTLWLSKGFIINDKYKITVPIFSEKGRFSPKYILKVCAIDKNIFDFALSFRGEGESSEPTYNVSGGLGVFGSLAVDSVEVYVK
jgi:hypothetical protein